MPMPDNIGAGKNHVTPFNNLMVSEEKGGAHHPAGSNTTSTRRSKGGESVGPPEGRGSRFSNGTSD